MKKLVNILLIALIMIVLGFIIMNSSSKPDVLLYPEYSFKLIKGVDFSHINTKGHSSHLWRSNNNYVGNSLIENLYNHLPVSNSSSRGKTPIANNNNFLAMSGSSSSYGISIRKRTDNLSGGGMSSSVMLPFVGSKRNDTGSQAGTSSGILATNSLLGSNSGRSAAPLITPSDYIEGDITHPGGYPTGEAIGDSVPVGDGTLPFLMFISCYVLWLYKKQ